jgi:hypothetical protein
MKMNDDFSRLETLVSRWVVETGLHAKSGSTDKNKYSEYFAAELLNAAFSYKLKVLPKNHPGIDLGDSTHGIAFSITSRTGADKIRKDLQTFKDKKLHDLYPQGIRFLLLVDQKVAYCLFALPFTNHPKNGNLYCFTVSLFSVKIKLRKLK